MKAIKLNNRIYKVTEERGAFVYYIDEKGKNRVILSKEVEVIESSEVERTEIRIKSKKLNKANFMSAEEFAKTEAGMMSNDEWIIYREKMIKDSLPSNLR
jgi:hypothetical protein